MQTITERIENLHAMKTEEILPAMEENGLQDMELETLFDMVRSNAKKHAIEQVGKELYYTILGFIEEWEAVDEAIDEMKEELELIRYY